ncbi:GTP-binding protein Rho1 [Nowakowskiella sp. JEL0078]|nr:GTP-binding protein Rho1 [Nowakowskiella sp. JEL0078]
MVEIRKKLVVVGDGACGKTSLLIRYIKNDYNEEYVPTVFDTYVSEITVDGRKVEMALWDTAGQEGYDRLRPLSYEKSSIVLICYAVDTPDSLENISVKWVPEVTQFCGTDIRYLLIGCKADLRNEENVIKELAAEGQSPVTFEQGSSMASKIRAFQYLECSAKTGLGVSNVFDAATRAALSHIEKRRKPICNLL